MIVYKSKKLLELAKKILGEWLHQSLSFQKSKEGVEQSTHY